MSRESKADCGNGSSFRRGEKHMINRVNSIGFAAFVVIGITSSAVASPIAASYTTGGATTGTGPWTMTSTDSSFSVLRFVLNTPIQFQDFSSLSVSYNAILGGIAGGAPRFVFVMDFNNDSVVDGTFVVHWGPAGTFVDATIGVGNTGNLLALNDIGRYDLGGIGGSIYTDRAAALAMAGSYYVLRASLVIDSFGGHDREFIIDGISGESSAVAQVPEPGTLVLFATALLSLFGFGMMRRRSDA